MFVSTDFSYKNIKQNEKKNIQNKEKDEKL